MGNRRSPRWVLLTQVALLVGGCVLASSTFAADAAVENADRLFTLRVLPLLKVKCFGCHGNDPKDLRGDYSLIARDVMIRGGESEEPAVIPGHPDESPLYQAVLWEGSEMPPKENDRLTQQETDWIKAWIAAGAPWPSAKERRAIQETEWAKRETDEGTIVDTSGGQADDWTYRRYQAEDIWAFQPIRKPVVPGAKAGRHPIDSFIDQKLSDAELSPADIADPRDLIRRVSYDLTGLPPTPKQVRQFVAAWQKDQGTAWSEAIERLLQSDHYGERWAQHWLDVVRYADTGGFSNDYERSNAWRYRDYVIRAFNDDLPFNQFVVEQIAGDEVEQRMRNGESLSEFPADAFDRSAAELTVATGMLRMGPWGTAMIPKEEARQIYLDDLVHNVGQSFLSIPLRCCKCHDHKFDPIPTRDYYSLYAAFATTQVAEVPAEFLDEENLEGFDEKRRLTEELLAYAKAELKKVNDKQESAARLWYQQHDLPYKDENARKKDPESKKPPRHVGLTPEEKG
ncbi:MAG: DUF1549 domain-containing protein, partial [Planctomycetota bacterium]